MDQICRSLQSLAELEEILKYKFNDKSLLEEAITHSSMNETKSYQRLEFLGDSVLSYLVTKHLYRSYPEHDEGTLTSLRSGHVDNEKFATVSVKHKFHQYLHMKTQPELQRNIQNFVKAIEDESLHGGGFDPPKVLADILESIAGAVLVDSEYSVDRVWKVFMPLLEPLVTPETLQQHPVSELNELCQKHRKHIQYRDARKGNKVRVKVLIDGKGVAIGEDQKKELAQKAAAKHALNELKEMLNEEDRVKKAREEEKHSTCHLNNFCSRNHWPPPFFKNFFSILWELMDTNLKKSTSFHPQNDFQEKVVKRTLVHLLHGYCDLCKKVQQLQRNLSTQ